LDSDHRELHVATVEPERQVRRELFSLAAEQDDLLHQQGRRLDD
jgi:hypothetical protein